ncbi:hypothetical protein WN55_03249 [Dufourea novaeangliae]|uniref:Uncharacterized protein n=1 Tax=Dufourea novaeangliae TaxID=178035 RepID=A0A154PLL0_DUFNO|nr:hypothetical protein WN55_03249 [Dufourea novaeangliae]
MQWRRQRRVTHVIGSSNHVLLLARYQDAPPGEEDEEEGLRNGYVKGQENDTGGHNFERNGQGGGYKSRRSGNGSSSGYNGGGARSHRDESDGTPSKPKIIFNEDEYTRITTPRQDMLFKKGYLSRKKPWAGNASTSATPSTTESQSASHSTAGRDGSETTEDQQLLDRDCGASENPPMVESRAQLGYGTFYDHASGYYYEYPVMLVGPAPVPAQVGPGVLAAVPCEPVPLRPIEWINPAFMPKLTDQPYCMMNYQTAAETTVTLVEEQETSTVPVENTNGTCNESGTGSGASSTGSVAGEVEEHAAEAANNTAKEDPTEMDRRKMAEEQPEDMYMDEHYVEEQCLENGMNGGTYLKPMLMPQPVHVSHVIPAVPQPYMYPGHYMFGPPLVNVNGVTIQGGPMIRTTDVAVMSAACAKRRKKKKRRKQRLAAGNTEDEEEGEYSSECDTGRPSSRLSWTACSTSTTTTTTTTTTTIGTRTLNPECQEFQLRPVVELNTPISEPEEGSVVNQSSALSSDTASIDQNNEPCNGIADDSKDRVDELIGEKSKQINGSLSDGQPSPLEAATDQNNEANRLTNCFVDDEETLSANEVTTDADLPPVGDTNNLPNDSSGTNESRERSRKEVNGVKEKAALTNGKLDSDSSNEDTTTTTVVASKPSSLHNDERTRSRSGTPKTESVEKGENHESLTNAKSSLPKRKYSAKGTKFVREPTPGPDLDSTAEQTAEMVNDVTQSLNNVSLNDYTKGDSTFGRDKTENEVSSNCMSKTVSNHLIKEEPIETSNEDSGFESQTTRHSDYPITEAVTEWLRRVNSPDMFITSTVRDSETEDEDEVEEPPKNLQGNPMPALSANGGADNLGLSRTTSCGEFARISNVKSTDQPDITNGGSRKRKDGKRKTGERKRVRHVEGKLDEVVSSSDSCGQHEDPVNRKKNSAKDVGDVCEFTEKDSVAGMRVASSSRMDSKRINARRTKRQGGGRSNRDPMNNNEKIKHLEDTEDGNDKGTTEDTMNVKTFEKGEIVVSEDGKLLTTSTYETVWNSDAPLVIETTKNETTKQPVRKIEGRSSSVEEENGSGILSLGSIEEPDVLECWEAETIEPVITPKKMLQCRGVSCEGEAGEEDNIEVKQVNVDYVQKYYRLARESATSVEEDLSSKINVDSVPNRSEETTTGEVSTERGTDTNNIPIDEAIEVYESCYTGKAPFLAMDSKVFKSRTLYGQEGEGPIPCRAVCCIIQ